MKTSYFVRYKGENGVSIAQGTPKWFKGKLYLPLCPPWDLIKKVKEDGDIEYYTQEYYKRVLSKLDPVKVYNDLGEDAVLLCWEKSGEFCHRYIVAVWLEKHLGVKIEEYVG